MRVGIAVCKTLLRCEYFVVSSLRVYCVIGFIPSMFRDIQLVWHARCCFDSVPAGLVLFGSCRVRMVSVRTFCLVLNVRSNISTHPLTVVGVLCLPYKYIGRTVA